MRLRNSFWAMLGRDEPPVANDVLEKIRTAMLNSLENHSGPGQIRIETQIAFATELAELWDLRPGLLQVLSSISGEKIAERELKNITALFVGHFPVSE
jgi:hypothetical protein